MAAVAGVESRDYSGSYIDLDEGMREDPRSNYLTAAESDLSIDARMGH